jgi:hypothetical protein
MAAIPYALSVHHFISTVGADAGFAAIIGLAVVVLLFFAHARETANLRERANEAEDALHRLEQYVDQLSRSGPAPAAAPPPAPAPASAPAVAAPTIHAGTTAAPAAAAHAGTAAPVAARAVAPARPPIGVMATAPGAPAGVGAPALSAATRLIPAADDGAISISSNRSDTAAGVGATSTGITAAVMDAPSPPPSTTAGGANGNRIQRPAPVPPPPSAGQTMSGRERLSQRAAPARPAATSGQRRRRGQRSGGSRVGRGAIVLATALIVVVAAGVLLVVTNSGGGSSRATASKPARSTSASASRSHKTKGSAAVTPASVTVAVLNGTSTTNLAHNISTKLQAAGFKQGTIATATDQTQSSTIVGYLPNHKREALAVAQSLKLGPASVQAVDPNNRAVACSGSATSCPAQVVVTVGTDLANA